MDRRAPIILLIEDDEADRMTLARMLRECDYNVMAASRGADALDTFVIHHLHIALVVSSSRLSDFGRAQLFDALYRIDGRVPIVMAARYASRGPNGGEDPGRALAFAELIAQVQYRLHGTPASAPAPAPASASAPVSGLPSHRAFNWPLRDEDVDQIEWADVIEEEAINEDVRGDEELLERVGQSEGLKPIASRDPRNYLVSLSRARRTRRRLIGRIGVTVAAGSALIATALLEMRTTTARAIAQDAAVAAPIVPLFSTPLSGRVGLVRLVPAARVKRSTLADDLRTARRDP